MSEWMNGWMVIRNLWALSNCTVQNKKACLHKAPGTRNRMNVGLNPGPLILNSVAPHWLPEQILYASTQKQLKHITHI